MKISRINGKIYYSINGEEIDLDDPYADVNANTWHFGTNVWFGGAPEADGVTMQRPLKGTLTDMYIKLAK